jgi:ABC-type lipoprotein export system ATPase subunit
LGCLCCFNLGFSKVEHVLKGVTVAFLIIRNPNSYRIGKKLLEIEKNPVILSPRMSLLEIQNLVKSYPSPEGGVVKVLEVKEFRMEKGEQVALQGDSGSGKTTFLHLLSGILQPDDGRILLDGAEISKLNEAERDRLRATSIGYIFQTFNLLQGFTCLENVLLGMSFGPGANESRAKELLDRVGLSDRFDYLPRQLSIGQQQRVAVARALANRPSLVLADEPTGNLDQANTVLAIDLIRKLCAENEAGLLLVSHDLKVVDSLPRKVEWENLNLLLGEEAEL